MTRITIQAIVGLSALLGVLTNLAAAKPQPKVWGLDFSKRVARNTPETNRLRRRQKALSVGLGNDEVEYVRHSAFSPCLQLTTSAPATSST